MNLLQKPKVIYGLLIALVLADRLFLLFNFGFQYVDSDAVIIWHGAADYSRFIFHEPYFYGQSYNLMLEAFFAAPLIGIGVPFHIALPIVTSFLILFPFIYAGIICYRHEQLIAGICFIAMPLLLPLEYGFLTTVSRGFVTGIFFCGFLIHAFFKPRSYKTIVLFFVAGYAAVWFNPNALVAVIPPGLFLLYHNFVNYRFYLMAAILACPFIFTELQFKRFYRENPEYEVHQLWAFEFHPQWAIDAISEMDKFFSYLMPIVWPAGWLVFPIALVFAGILFKKDKINAGIIFLSLLLILLMPSIPKVNDHSSDTILLSSSRMFLALPFWLGTVLLLFFKEIKVKLTAALPVMLYTGLAFFIVKLSVTDNRIQAHFTTKDFNALAIKPVDKAYSDCQELADFCQKHEVDQIIFLQGSGATVPILSFYNYLCPILEKDFPPGILNIYERRTWEYLRQKDSVFQTVLVFGDLRDAAIPNDSATVFFDTNPQKLLIKNNRKTSKELILSMNGMFKRHFYEN